MSAKFAALRQRLAADPQRPRYHFLAPANWLNDPNGLIHWQGTHHLFYQHNPRAAVWGKIHWGHAASADLVHWHDLPIALQPGPEEYDADGCWSGCAVDDGGIPTLIYTGWRNKVETVCVATGSPDLLTWEKDPRNPVIAGPPERLVTTGFRDPYIWREGGHESHESHERGRENSEWRMAIGSGFLGQGGAVLLYRSSDLRAWEYLGPLVIGAESAYEDMWECPCFFPLGEKHVLIVSLCGGHGVLYFVGAYTGERFIPARQGIVDGGAQFFAPQVWRDAEGRYLMIGWLPEGRSEAQQRAAGWAGVLSLPRVLSLTEEGALAETFAPELAALRGVHLHFAGLDIAPGAANAPGGVVEKLPVTGSHLEFQAEFDGQEAASYGLVVRCATDDGEATWIGYDVAAQELFIDARQASHSSEVKAHLHRRPFALKPGEALRLHVFIDGSVIEVCANERSCLSARIYPTRSDSVGVGAFARGGPAHLRALDVWKLTGV